MSPLRDTFRALLARVPGGGGDTAPEMIARALGGLALGAPVALDALPECRGTPVRRALLSYAAARAGLVLPDGLGADESSVAPRALWALRSAHLGEPTSFFSDLLARQQPTGPFLAPDPYASPDLHWFDELVLLHALATFAAMRPSPQVDAALLRAVEFHTRETQPDHATNHPWALHAFARTEDGLLTADMLLHAAQSQNVGGLDAIGRILVADALLAMNVS